MRRHVRLDRPQPMRRDMPSLARPLVVRKPIARRDIVPVRREARTDDFEARSPLVFLPDPYVDYGRFLTPEGGILLVYKDLDLRLRHTLWRIFAWTAATGFEGWYLWNRSPVQSAWINAALFVAVAIVNAIIVAKPVEVYRTIEIRPEGMILEGSEFFSRYHMEGGWPFLAKDAEGNQVLCGIYGTRFVEYLTVRRFDDLDRMPEVIAAHLQDALRQLWTTAL